MHLSHSFKRNLFVLPGCWCLCLKFLMKLPHSQKQKCIRVCKRRQHYSCVFICLGDFRVWKFDVETSDLDYSSTAKYRRCCHSSMGIYRCLEHCAGASFLCCLSPVHDYSSVRNMTFTKQKKSNPSKSFHPFFEHACLYKTHWNFLSQYLVPKRWWGCYRSSGFHGLQ